MNSSYLYGVPSGAMFGQNDRVEELNKRMYQRHIPDNALAPNFDPRPISTKYDNMSIVDRRKFAHVGIQKTVQHDIGKHFNPGTHRAPPMSILRDVNIETMLRNQTTALQHGNDQAVYVPSSDSDLYNVQVPLSSTGDGLSTHPNLFYQPHHTNMRESSLHCGYIGKDMFLNNTRVQLRNM